MYKIKIFKVAIHSITSITKHIAEDNLFYANKVQEYIYKSIYLLKDFPFIWKEIDKNHRIIIESHYKFKIVYKITWKIIFIVWIYKEQKDWK